MTLPTYHVVVAKYKEDISWTKQFEPTNMRIYDKSGEPSDYIARPNIGRESETYIHYILTHYDALPDYVFFLQGNPFDHMYSDVNPSKIREEFEEMLLAGTENPVAINTTPIKEQINLYPSMYIKEYLNYITMYDQKTV